MTPQGTIRFAMPLLLGALLLAPAPARAARGPAWGSSFAAALQQAKKSGRLVMVDFYTDWCGYCKQMDRETYVHPAVLAAMKPFVPVKLNAEKAGAPVARRYRVASYPVVLFVNARGEVQDQIRGYVPAGPFVRELQRIAAAHREVPALEARLAGNARDAEAAARLAVIYAARGDHFRAVRALDRAEKAGPARAGRYMARAYNAVAGSYVARDEVRLAEGLVRKAIRTAKDPADLAEGRLNLAVCYLSRNQAREGIAELEAVAAMKSAPAAHRARARELLARVRS